MDVKKEKRKRIKQHIDGCAQNLREMMHVAPRSAMFVSSFQLVKRKNTIKKSSGYSNKQYLKSLVRGRYLFKEYVAYPRKDNGELRTLHILWELIATNLE